jgi:hypothetical protein
MQHDFADYFLRVGEVLPLSSRKKFSKPITTRTKSGDAAKLVNLFVDCFDHHTRCSDREPVKALGLLPPQDPRRHISRDLLFLHFLDFHYRPPRISDIPEEVTNSSDYREPIRYLCREISTFPITASPATNTKIGSNTFTYLTGEVGVGKSLLVASLFRELAFRMVISVYRFTLTLTNV